MFRGCTNLLWCQQTVFIGSLIFILLYLQEGRGVSAIGAGLSTFPEALGGGLTAQLVSRLFPRIGPKRLLTAGFVGLTVLAGVLSLAGAEMSLWGFRAVCFGLGTCTAFFIVPSQAAAFTQISSADTGQATAIYSTWQRAAGSLGVAMLVVVYAAAGGNVVHVRPSFSAFRWVFVTAVGTALLGVLLSQKIRDSDAALAMGRPRTPPEVVTTEVAGSDDGQRMVHNGDAVGRADADVNPSG
jgi:MFS family permease